MTIKPWRLLCIAVVFALGAGACGSETVTAEPAEEGPQPTLSITIEHDKKSGQNVQFTTSDFAFTPESVGSDDVANEGYARLFVDNNDPIRVYTDWVHLSLEPGDHEIRAELVTNNGVPYAEASATSPFSVPEPTGDGHSHGHSADPIEFVGDKPEITVSVTEDSVQGWNVQAEITNFRFAPDHVSGENVDGEGHLHLYVNGVKVQRLYGNWWHLPKLAGGENIITVEANANDHTPYVVNGEPISVTTTVIGSDEAMTDSGEHDDPAMADDGDHHDDDDHDGAEGEHDDPAMADDGVLKIEVDYSGGEIEGVGSRVEVELGQTVMLSVSSDVAEHVHVHGYDLFVDVGPDAEAMLMFDANVPGVFEIEFEDSRILITELEVR